MARRIQVENQHINVQMQASNQFLASLSHELRTPLNAVLGFADLLASREVELGPARREQCLRHIQTSGRHLLQLIEDVLELARIDAGQTDCPAEPVDLEKAVAEVIDIVHTPIVRKSLQVSIDVDSGLGSVVVPPGRLKRTLMHLLAHAVHRAPEGSCVSVRVGPQGAQRFLMEVSDCGAAIPEHELAALFELAEAGTAPAPPEPGNAMPSLALTRRLVEAMGGELGARSSPGVGNSFFLVMDRVQAPPAER